MLGARAVLGVIKRAVGAMAIAAVKKGLLEDLG
jgi:hypothetical protein